MRKQVRFLKSIVIVAMVCITFGLASGAQGIVTSREIEATSPVVNDEPQTLEIPLLHVSHIRVQGGSNTKAIVDSEGTFFAVNTALAIGSHVTIDLTLQQLSTHPTTALLTPTSMEGMTLQVWTLDPTTGETEEAVSLPSGEWLFNMPASTFGPVTHHLLIRIAVTTKAKTGKADLSFQLQPFEASRLEGGIEDSQPSPRPDGTKDGEQPAGETSRPEQGAGQDSGETHPRSGRFQPRPIDRRHAPVA